MISNDHLQHLKASIRDAVIRVDSQRRPSAVFSRFKCRQFELAGGLGVYDIHIDPVIIKRCAADIALDLNHDYFLTTQLQGNARIKQANAEFSLEPGDLALMTGGLPFSVEYAKPSRRLIVRIPDQVFRKRLLGHGQTIPLGNLPGSGLGRIVNGLLQSVAYEAENLTVTDQYTLAESLLELTGALTRSSGKPCEQGRSRRHSDLLNRIHTFIKAHYMDCELTPDKIARAHGISTRYLHSLFRQSGTTVLKSVWERRLKATREDLLDPSLIRVRISDIAFQRGFTDPAHFSRTFRNRFGLSPRQLRSLAPGSDLH
ncbi:MAG: helix-turn-helix domain-containing protein [Gammaproteobacteria bacterium]